MKLAQIVTLFKHFAFSRVGRKRRDSLEAANFTGVEECQSEPTSTEAHKSHTHTHTHTAYRTCDTQFSSHRSQLFSLHFNFLHDSININFLHSFMICPQTSEQLLVKTTQK